MIDRLMTRFGDDASALRNDALRHFRRCTRSGVRVRLVLLFGCQVGRLDIAELECEVAPGRAHDHTDQTAALADTTQETGRCSRATG